MNEEEIVVATAKGERNLQGAIRDVIRTLPRTYILFQRTLRGVVTAQCDARVSPRISYWKTSLRGSHVILGFFSFAV